MPLWLLLLGIFLMLAVGLAIWNCAVRAKGTAATPIARFSVSIASATKAEASASFTGTVTRSGVTTGGATVDWAVSGGGGVAPVNAADFGGVFPSGTVTFANGDTSKTFSFSATDDSTVEDDETGVVTISNPSVGAISIATAGFTITNDDSAGAGPTPSPGVPSTLSVPGLTRTSSVLVSPPTLVGDFDVTYQPNDWAHLEMADDYAFTTHVGDFYAQLPGVGNPTFSLGGYVPAAIGFARLRGLKAGSPTQSISAEDWTAYATPVAWGDSTAPTISTSSTATVAENAALAISLAANEGIASWAITGGVDQTAFEISGTTLRWLGNGTADYEVPTDSDLNNTYVVQVSATDYAGNVGSKTITVTVTDVVEFVPTVWSPTNKTAATTITGSGLILNPPNTLVTGLYEGASVTTSFTSGVREMAFSVDWNGNTGGGTGVYIGVMLSSQSLVSGASRIGLDTSTGLVFLANNFPGNDVYQNGGYEGHSPSPFTTGADNRIILDMGAKTVKIVIGGVLQGFTVDISAWATGPVTFFGLANDDNIITINPTPSGLQSGSTAWGA